MPADVVPPSRPSYQSHGLTRLFVVGTLLLALVIAGFPSPSQARQPVPGTPVVADPPAPGMETLPSATPLPSEPSGIPPVLLDDTAPEPTGVVTTAFPVACQIVLRIWGSTPPDGATVMTDVPDPVIGAAFRVGVTGGGERMLLSDAGGSVNLTSGSLREIGLDVVAGDEVTVVQTGTPDGRTIGSAPYNRTFSWQSEYDATCRVEQIIVNATIAAPASPSASASPAPTATPTATATTDPTATTIPTATATTAPTATRSPTSTSTPTATTIPTATIPLNFGQIEVVTIARTPVGAPSGEAPVRLPGARFQIVNRTTQATVATLTTGSNGSVRSDLLPLGTYDLILVTPPDGYLTAPARGFFIEQPTIQYLVFELEVNPNVSATATPRPRQTTVATGIATATATGTASPTIRASATTIGTATATPRPRSSVTVTVTATLPPTATPRPRQSPTVTGTATATPRPRSSATVRPSVVSTATTRPTGAPTQAATAIATASPTRAATSTSTRQATTTATRAATTTATRGATTSATATRAPRATRTASVGSTATRVTGTLTPTIRPTRDLTTRTPGATRAATLTPTAAVPIQVVVVVEICVDPRYAWTGEFGLPTTLADLDRSRCRPARSGETQVTLTSSFPTYLPVYRQTGATNGTGRISFTVPGNAADRIGQLHLEGRAIAQDAGLRMTAGGSLSVQLTIAYPATGAADSAVNASAAATGPPAGGRAGWAGVVSVLSLVSAVAGGAWRSSRRR